MRFFSLPTYSSTPGGTESIPSTDSNQTDRRFTLSGIAKWVLENYAGTSLGGSSQSVKTAMTVNTPTITAGTNVTESRKAIYKIGRIVIFSLAFSTSATFASTDDIYSGFPVPSSNTDIPGIADGAAKDFFVNTSGKLRFNGSTTASACFVNGVYVSAS